MLKKLFDLQLFADENAGDNDGAGTEENAGKEVIVDEKKESDHLSFDDFLGNKENQAEFDRRVNKAIKTAVANAKDKWELETSDKLTEAQKLAKMNKEEKALYQNKKLQEELDALKREKAVSQMLGTARDMLREEGVNIPDAILTNLVKEDAEATKKAVESFSKEFKSAVQLAVKDALKGKAPEKGKGKSTITKAQIMELDNPLERQKLIAENLELFS